MKDIDEIRNEIIKRDYIIYMTRLTSGESEKSARSGLSIEFRNWKEEQDQKRDGVKFISSEIPEKEIISDNNALWICEYCFPRGVTGIQEVTKCEYCDNWFCDKHLNVEGGHPCPDYKDKVK